MLFSSISFLYIFLPIVLGLYYIAPKQFKNMVLLVSSLFFYFYGEPIYIFLMIFSILSGYLHGLWIEKMRNSKHHKLPMISSIVVSIGLLVYFKYSDFIISNINSLFSNDIPLLKLALPIGISFYTFQILSYTIDVYRENAKVQKNILDFATYVCLFPQLIAGPIVRYTTIEEELTGRTHSLEKVSYGIKRFIIGLSKKVLLANTLGEVVDIFSKTNEKSVLFYWLAGVSFSLQIYFDFSGYSDMGIGLGKIFGFNFLENFNYPYISKSITEFWRRWHISLGTWFRDYVYIPLGGNRVSVLKWIRNILVVWFLTGLWHGAQWNFIFWGLYFAFFLLLEKFFLKKILEKLPQVISHIYTIFTLIIGFVLFNAQSMYEALENIKGMFGLTGESIWNMESIYYFKSYIGVIIIGIIASTPIVSVINERLKKTKNGEKLVDIIHIVVLPILLLVSTGYLIDGSFNPFLYFRF